MQLLLNMQVIFYFLHRYSGVLGDCLEDNVCGEGCAVCGEDREEQPDCEVFTVSGK